MLIANQENTKMDGGKNNVKYCSSNSFALWIEII